MYVFFIYHIMWMNKDLPLGTLFRIFGIILAHKSLLSRIGDFKLRRESDYQNKRS
jgi:hypothetical protein